MSCSYQIIELVAKRDQYLYIITFTIISLMFVVFCCFYRLRLLYIYTDFYTSRWFSTPENFQDLELNRPDQNADDEAETSA